MLRELLTLRTKVGSFRLRCLLSKPKLQSESPIFMQTPFHSLQPKNLKPLLLQFSMKIDFALRSLPVIALVEYLPMLELAIETLVKGRSIAPSKSSRLSVIFSMVTLMDWCGETGTIDLTSRVIVPSSSLTFLQSFIVRVVFPVV